MRLLQALVFAILFPVTALASPVPEFVCFDREFMARIGFTEDWSEVYMTNNWGDFTLAAAETGNGLRFEDGTYRLSGSGTEATVFTGETVLARCHQTAESIKAMALYGNPENRGRWSRYEIMGRGWQTVRAAPSVLSEKIDTLSENEPVLILENTDQFLDGYYWFKIEYSEGLQGYIWGALLCSDTDDPELSQTVRRCN
jgi:hypothetical protein